MSIVANKKLNLSYNNNIIFQLVSELFRISIKDS